MTREHERLLEDRQREQNWKRWGPYLSERQWGTVREDYSKEIEQLRARRAAFLELVAEKQNEIINRKEAA